MVKKPEKISVFALSVLLSFLFQCAKEGIPPGGPEDTAPPEVILVSPKPDSIEVGLDSRIEITFSESMMAKITEESIFVSPLPRLPFDFSWRGKRLTLAPQEPLLPDRTYVVSVGTDAQDLRRNRLSKSYTYAFSTGSQLDYGSISGEVWTKQRIGLGREMGISVWAFLFPRDELKADPEREKPDYVTQTDSQGKYFLENLSLGRYRLFAVQGLNRDLIWDWEKEAMGLTTGEVILTEQDNLKTHVDFILDKKDKSPPGLLDCNSLNENLVRLDFDEELDEQSVLQPANIEIFSVSTQKSLKILSVFLQGQESKKIFLLTEGMNPKEKFELKISKVTDKAGNSIDTASAACLFQASDIPDTVGLKIIDIFPKEQEANLPLDTKIKLVFDRPPEQETVEASFSLTDSNQIKITGGGEWINPTTFVFSPHSLLSSKMNYQIKLKGKEIRDISGNVTGMADSAFTSSFVTLDPNILGSVSGKIGSEESKDSTAIVLILWNLNETELWYQITLQQPGGFVFKEVLAGKYFMGGYVDHNGDGKLTLGQMDPFSPSDPFAVYPDTIHVRSRWETEDVELVIP